MRDPARLPIILSQLQDIWNKHPDLRLGQLILNIFPPTSEGWIYNIEDQDLINKIKEFYESLQNKA